jgi:hypothetical protein
MRFLFDISILRFSNVRRMVELFTFALVHIGIGCSFKFPVEIGASQSAQYSNNAKNEVRFKQLIRDPYSLVHSQSTLQRQL